MIDGGTYEQQRDYKAYYERLDTRRKEDEAIRKILADRKRDGENKKGTDNTKKHSGK